MVNSCLAGPSNNALKVKCMHTHPSNNPPTSAADGTVRAFDGAPVVADVAFIPQIARGGKWMGVCGNGVSTNDNTANIICTQLGFDKGMNHGWFALTQDSASVGRCLPTEALTACTAGYNDFEGKRPWSTRASPARLTMR